MVGYMRYQTSDVPSLSLAMNFFKCPSLQTTLLIQYLKKMYVMRPDFEENVSQSILSSSLLIHSTLSAAPDTGTGIVPCKFLFSSAAAEGAGMTR